MKTSKYLSALSVLLLTASFAAAAGNTYYLWCQDAAGNLPLARASYWYDSAYTTPVGTSAETITFTADDTLIRDSKPLDGAYQFYMAGSTFDIGALTQTGTLTGAWHWYNFENCTANFGTINQDSDQSLIIRTRNGTTLDVTVGDIDVTRGYLYLGRADTGQALKSLTVNNTVSVTDSAFCAYGTTVWLKDDITLSGGLLQFAMGDYAGNTGSLTIDGDITGTKTATKNSKIFFGEFRAETITPPKPAAYDYLNTVTVNGAVSMTDGEIYFRADSMNVNNTLTATNTKLLFNNGRSRLDKGADVRIKNIVHTNVSSDTGFNIGAGSVSGNAYVFTEVLNSFIAGDISESVSNATYTNWNVTTFKVKKDEFEGATGTFTYNNTSSSRAFIFADTVDIDNFNVNSAGNAVMNLMTIVRQSNVGTDLYGGSLHVGNFVGETMSRLRVGAFYGTNGTEAVWNFAMHDTVTIDSLTSHGTEVYVYGGDITVGELNLSASSAGQLESIFGHYSAGGAARSLTIGADSDSVSTISGLTNTTIFSSYSPVVTVNGTLNLQDGGFFRVSPTLSPTFTAETLVIDSTNKSTTFFDNLQGTVGLQSINIDKVVLQNASTGKVSRINLNASGGSSVGEVLVKASCQNISSMVSVEKNVSITKLKYEQTAQGSVDLFDLSSLSVTNFEVGYNANVQVRNATPGSTEQKTVTVGSFTVNTAEGTPAVLNTIVAFGPNVKLHVTGDFTNNNTYGHGGYTFRGGLDVDGAFITNGTINMVTSITETTTFDYFMGAVGGTGGGRISTSPAYSKGAFNMTLDGTSALNGKAKFYGVIADVESNDTADTIAGYGDNYKVSLTIDSSDGTLVQYLYRGASIRGDTVITSGTLMASSDATSQVGGQYFSRVVLEEEGALGACGNGTEIGEMKMTTLDWSGGAILVDVSGASADKLTLTGDFLKNAAGKLEFVFDGDVLGGTYYQIMGWGADGTVEFLESDFTADLGGTNALSAQFELDREGGHGLWVSFVIPEPSTYAAVFGAIALVMALRRRRK